jgi:hypothetical protein
MLASRFDEEEEREKMDGVLRLEVKKEINREKQKKIVHLYRGN